MYFSCICLGDEFVSRLLRLQLGFVLARSADTAADARHTLDEVLRQTSHFQKKKGFLTLSRTVAARYLDIGILTRLFQTLPKRFPNTLASCMLFSSGSRFTSFARIIARISP